MSCKKVRITCTNCDGEGKVSVGNNKKEKCYRCNGSGKEDAIEHHFHGAMCDCGQEAAPDGDDQYSR